MAVKGAITGGAKKKRDAEKAFAESAEIQRALEIQQMQSLVDRRFNKDSITPAEIAATRREIFTTVQQKLPVVEQVLAGNTHWNAQQTRLFGMLLNKVMPDLSHKFIESEHREVRDISKLSIDELYEIAHNGPRIQPGHNTSARAVAAADSILDATYEEDTSHRTLTTKKKPK